MEEVDKGWRIRMGVSWRMFLLVPAYPGSPGQKQWLRQNLQVGDGGKLSLQRCEDQGAEGMGCGGVGSGAQPPLQKFLFSSPINGAIWCTFSTF